MLSDTGVTSVSCESVRQHSVVVALRHDVFKLLQGKTTDLRTTVSGVFRKRTGSDSASSKRNRLTSLSASASFRRRSGSFGANLAACLKSRAASLYLPIRKFASPRL